MSDYQPEAMSEEEAIKKAVELSLQICNDQYPGKKIFFIQLSLFLAV